MFHNDRTALGCAAQGYAISFEEYAVGVSALGVPIFVERLNEAPSARRSRDDFLSWLPAVKAAAAKLGASWPQEPTGLLSAISG